MKRRCDVAIEAYSKRLSDRPPQPLDPLPLAAGNLVLARAVLAFDGASGDDALLDAIAAAAEDALGAVVALVVVAQLAAVSAAADALLVDEQAEGIAERLGGAAEGRRQDQQDATQVQETPDSHGYLLCEEETRSGAIGTADGS
jgi:hypothetical protein